ncbi:MAG TPA: alpha/beta hydrolase [Prolixibacteraceae bacterium]|nr:alpha/beta hydrolase [Prolixibacteraceae bacterium]
MEQVFEVDGYRIYTKVEGEGKPLLLLHSYWGSHLLFDHLASVLSARMKVIRIDLPGHGNSGIPPMDYTFEKFADVLNELLTRLDVLEKVSVVGHSMGGYVAMAYAVKYPERICSLVLMNSPIKSGDIKSIKLREQEARLLQKGKRNLLLQLTIPSNFAKENLDSMDNALVLLNQTSNQVTVEGALRSIYAINNRSNYLGDLQAAHFPILIVIGKYDNVYGAEEQLNDASQISKAEVLMLQHAGHLGFLEEEDLVVKKLSAFLDVSL